MNLPTRFICVSVEVLVSLFFAAQSLADDEMKKSAAGAASEIDASAVRVEGDASQSEKIDTTSGAGSGEHAAQDNRSAGSVTQVLDTKPDEVYLGVLKARDAFEKGDYAAAVELLNLELPVLEKENKNGLCIWQVLSDLKLCLQSMHKDREAQPFSARADELAGGLKLAPATHFELVQENQALRSAVNVLVAMSALSNSRQVVVKGPNGYGVTSASPSWVQKFAAGASLKQQGHYSQSEPFLLAASKEALEQNASPRDLAMIYSLLGGNYRYLKRYDESISFYKKALVLSEKEKGRNTADYATMLDNLAQVYSEKNDFAEAAALQESALRVYEKVLPANAPDLGQTFCNYADTISHLGAMFDAEKAYMKGIEIYKSSLPADDLRLAFAFDNLGSIYSGTGRLSQSELMRKKALDIFCSKLGNTHPDVTICVCNLAATFIAEQKFQEAKKLLEQHMLKMKQGAEAAELSQFQQQYSQMLNLIEHRKNAK